MTYELSCRIKAYIQPFERQLALRELQALAGDEPKPVVSLAHETDCFKVRSRLAPELLARELAFWEAVCGEKTLITTQSLRESTVNVVRNGVALDELASKLPFKDSVPLPNRRCLRYGSHGLHEYRGRFFPQLVRTFINIADLPQSAVVADPFCGSGTTAVEAILAGRTALGLDINPLSLLMARTKCEILRTKIERLEYAYEEIRGNLLSGKRPPSKFSRLAHLSPDDAQYLKGWFHAQILEDLDTIYRTICASSTATMRDFFLLALSNILRSVSWQKEDDLRVRKELKSVDEIDPIREFLEDLGRSVRYVLAFLRQERRSKLGKAVVEEGDARNLNSSWKAWKGKVDLVATSPPYANALPYLDTDRLSLCFLGLLPRGAHRDRDQAMIGNREITDKTRRHYWGEFNQGTERLPKSLRDLINRIYSLNENNGAGFRRRNLPSLLYKYFSDMKSVFIGLDQIMKSRASAFVVVGNNHTVAGGQRVDITTTEILLEIGEDVGLEVVECIPMEMLLSRDIFRRNAIESESILHFRKSA